MRQAGKSKRGTVPYGNAKDWLTERAKAEPAQYLYGIRYSMSDKGPIRVVRLQLLAVVEVQYSIVTEATPALKRSFWSLFLSLGEFDSAGLQHNRCVQIDALLL